jgi:nucleoside-diphosphate-sugar epimerase
MLFVLASTETMNILITGAFGFVGTNLSQSLKTSIKHHLIAIDIKEPANHIFDKYYSWNELENVDWSNVDAIIHLAGKAHDTKNTTEEKAYFDINGGLTQQIFEYFLQSNATMFIFFSSVKAVADSVNGEYLTEEAEPKPGTAYGRSKLEAEKFIKERMGESENERGCEEEKMRGEEDERARMGEWERV